jgi:Cu/Zn superoxide dismutase
MTHSRLVIHGILLISLLALTACKMPSSNNTKAMATLSASSEVPSTNSAGTGEANVTIDTKSDKLSWTVTYSGLSGVVTGAHFHGPAAVGTNASVAIPITGDMLSPMKGEATITNEQKTQLLDGKWYLNLHTAANPDGEIRGQVIVKP